MDESILQSDEEEITPQAVIEKLECAWLNEKFSPELLPHQSELVEIVLEQIQQMDGNIQRLNKNDFRITIHRMELDRIRFVVASYLRNRIEKIETFTVHILNQDSVRSVDEKYLSPQEHKFANDFLNNMESHFRLLALRHMPANFQDFDKVKMAVVPNVSSFVFLCAKKDVRGIIIEGDSETGDEVIDLAENSQHILQYNAISNYVISGEVQLI